MNLHKTSKNQFFNEFSCPWPIMEGVIASLIHDDNLQLQFVCDNLFEPLLYNNQFDQLIALNEKALTKALAEPSIDYKTACLRAYHIGYAYFQKRELNETFTYAEQCYKYHESSYKDPRSKDPYGYGLTLANRLHGHVHCLKGEYQLAIKKQEEALDIREQFEDDGRNHIVMCINDLARTYQLAGDFDGAEVRYLDALSRSNRLNYIDGIFYIKTNLAGLAIDKQDWEKAKQYASEVTTEEKHVKRQDTIATSYYYLAYALFQLGQPQEALPHIQKAVDLFASLHYHKLADAESFLKECEAACD